MSEVALKGVSKVYAGYVSALVDCYLSVPSGEWLTIVGPSGCGKTTLLRLIAGLIKPCTGAIRIGDQCMDGVPPAGRDVAMLFQRPALDPNKDVRVNIAFPLRLRKSWWTRYSDAYRRDESARISEVAGWLRIEHLLNRRVHELSGGEQQRVALSRCLVRKTKVGLLDEPFGHMDGPLRKKLTRELPLLRSRFPATMIIVTHDPGEAVALGDRIAVLQDGRVVQVDTPEQIRREPASAFVADFFRGA